MQFFRRLLSRRTVIGLAVFGFIVWCISGFLLGFKLQTGRETTYVTGPLTPAGSIDYPAAIGEKLLKGLTPDDNAAVWIDRAFGPGSISPELRAHYFQILGTKPLPEQGDYVVSPSIIIQQKIAGKEMPPQMLETMFSEIDRSRRRPWTREDFPLVAEWLEANALPLELIEQATKRSVYCSPLTTDDGLEHDGHLRESARMLTARAMLRLGQNQISESWSDLLACHRLSQLVSQGGSTMTSYLVAVALNSMATQSDAAVMAHQLTADQARKCLDDCLQLPAFGSLADALDQRQRLDSLDSVFQQIPSMGLDINTMLRGTNRLYDDVTAAMKLTQFADRSAKLTQIGTQLTQKIAAGRTPLRIALSVVSSQHRTRLVGDSVRALLLPALAQADMASTRAHIHRDLVRIGFALTAFHSDQGAYPATLEELVPKYLDTIPLDPFTEKPLMYTQKSHGFLIYSLGKNGLDEGGLQGGTVKADDVAFEVPPKSEE